MDADVCGDLLSLARELVRLLRERELEQALQRVRAARRDHATRSFEERAGVITQVNLTIHRLRAEREKVRAMVTSLPEKERLFAEGQIEPILDEVFNGEIAELKAVKRRQSKSE